MKVIPVVVVALAFAMPLCAQQQAFEGPIVEKQQETVDAIAQELDRLENDCGRIERTMSTRTAAENYVECVLQRLNSCRVSWASSSTELLGTARNLLNGMTLQRVPAGESVPENRVMFANVAGFLHARVGGWYKQTAVLVQRLFNVGLLTEATAQEAAASIQENLNALTKGTRDFMGTMQAEGAIDEQRLRMLIEKHFERVFQPCRQLVEQLAGRLNTAYNRLLRQYPDDFRERPDRFTEVSDLYGGIVRGSLEALRDHAAASWVDLNAQAPQ